MAKTGSSSLSRIAVWVILVLLIAGLAGFGAGGLGGNITKIGSVGETEIATGASVPRPIRRVRARGL